MRAAASRAASALARASAELQEHRRQELALKNSVRELEEGAAAYAEFAATDFSVAVTQQKELQRLHQLQADVAASVSAALATVEKLKHENKLAKFHAVQVASYPCVVCVHTHVHARARAHTHTFVRSRTHALSPCAPGPTDPVGQSYRLLTLWARAGRGAQGQ